VLFATLEAVESSPPLDVVHVRFTAQARDTEVPIQATPEQITAALARAPIEPYTEIWSLVRRSGAQSKPADFAVGRACPSCGAPIDSSSHPGASPNAGEMVKCRYCGALVCSGEHDWVLSEITQIVEWHPTATTPNGFDEIRARDPALAREVLEDRASFLFWKWVESARLGTLVPLRKHASTDFASAGPGMRFEWARGAQDVAVGGADILVVDAGPDGGLDHVYVLVHWSARLHGSASHTPMQTVLRLARKVGVASKLSMTAVVCQACGAPLVETDSPRCDHCGADLVDGAQSWVLDGVLAPPEVRVRDHASDELPEWLVPDIADPRERRVLLSRMAQVMARDGVLERRERNLLRMCAQRWGIPEEVVKGLLSSPPPGDVSTVTSSSPQWFLAGLVAAALADGRIDRSERTMLEQVTAAPCALVADGPSHGARWRARAA
jgi:hypothetical protein